MLNEQQIFIIDVSNEDIDNLSGSYNEEYKDSFTESNKFTYDRYNYLNDNEIYHEEKKDLDNRLNFYYSNKNKITVINDDEYLEEIILENGNSKLVLKNIRKDNLRKTRKKFDFKQDKPFNSVLDNFNNKKFPFKIIDNYCCLRNKDEFKCNSVYEELYK